MSVVGIDFGTQNSVIAVARHRSIDVISNEVSNRLTPSIVSFDSDAKRYIGEPAKTLEISKLHTTIPQLKRLVMLAAGDTLAQSDLDVFSLVHDLDLATGSFEQNRASAIQILAMFFGYLKGITLRALGLSSSPTIDCVIGVPCGWNDTHRRIIMDAAAVVHLSPLMLMNETTASALAFGLSHIDTLGTDPTFLLTVDIGHSVTQVSLSSLSVTGLVMLAEAWDPTLGGRDIDAAMAVHLAELFEAEKPALKGLGSAPKPMARLRAACEKAKKQLSASSITKISIESLFNDVDVGLTLNRDDLIKILTEKLDFFTRIRVLLDQMTQTAELPRPTRIEVVGGSTRIPAIKEMISSYFNDMPVSVGLNQDEAIARGAAYQCAILSPVFKVRPFEMKHLNLIPYALSYATDSRVVLFQPGAALPATRSVSFPLKQLPLTITLVSSNDNKTHSTWRIDAPSAETIVPSESTQQQPLIDGGGDEIPSATTEATTETTVSTLGDGAVVKIKVRCNSSGIITVDPKGSLWLPSTATAAADGTLVKSNSEVIQVHLLHNSSLPTEEITRLAGVEASMAASDRALNEAESSRNSLEEFLYDTRDALSSHLAPFIESAEEEAELRSELNRVEDWLYPADPDGADGLPAVISHQNAVTIASATTKRLCVLKDRFYQILERYHAYQLAVDRLSRANREASKLNLSIEEMTPEPPNTLLVIQAAERIEAAIAQHSHHHQSSVPTGGTNESSSEKPDQ